MNATKLLKVSHKVTKLELAVKTHEYSRMNYVLTGDILDYTRTLHILKAQLDDARRELEAVLLVVKQGATHH